MDKLSLFSLHTPRGRGRKNDAAVKEASEKLMEAMGALADEDMKRLFVKEKRGLVDFLSKRPELQNDYKLSAFCSEDPTYFLASPNPDNPELNLGTKRAIASYLLQAYGTRISEPEIEDIICEVYGVETPGELSEHIMTAGKDFIREFCEDCNVKRSFQNQREEYDHFSKRSTWPFIEEIAEYTEDQLPLSYIAYNLDGSLGFCYLSADEDESEIYVLGSRQARIFEDYKEKVPEEERAKIEKLLEFFDTPLERGTQTVLTPTRRCVVFKCEYKSSGVSDGEYENSVDTTLSSVRPFYEELLIELHEELLTLNARYGA